MMTMEEFLKQRLEEPDFHFLVVVSDAAEKFNVPWQTAFDALIDLLLKDSLFEGTSHA